MTQLWMKLSFVYDKCNLYCNFNCNYLHEQWESGQQHSCHVLYDHGVRWTQRPFYTVSNVRVPLLGPSVQFLN